MAGGYAAFEVVLGVEGGDLAGVGVCARVQEPDFLAVCEEDEGYFELIRVVAALVLGGDGVDGGALGFEGGDGAAGAVAQDVIGTGAVGEGVFVLDACTVGEVPAGVGEERASILTREKGSVVRLTKGKSKDPLGRSLRRQSHGCYALQPSISANERWPQSGRPPEQGGDRLHGAKPR